MAGESIFLGLNPILRKIEIASALSVKVGNSSQVVASWHPIVSIGAQSAPVGVARMSDTHSLLSRISSFRERLAQMPLLRESSHQLSTESAPDFSTALLQMNPQAQKQNLQLEVPSSGANLPPHLTHRVRKLLHDARELLMAERTITDDLFFARLASNPDTATCGEPLVAFHKHTIAATDSALRLTQSFPASAEHQSRMCEGLETILLSIRERLTITYQLLENRRKVWGRIERLTRLLCDLHSRRLVAFSSFTEIADEIITEARQGIPLVFHEAGAQSVARCVAAHSLTVAEVVARIVEHDFEWRSNPIVPVSAALIMDVGMLGVPGEIYHSEAEFRPQDWSEVEPHALAGAELLRSVMPEIGPIADAVAAHHERLDGTGYPRGLTADRLAPLTRLLAVADVYAASASDRPHRIAREPRSAMTEVLLMAEQGRLDHDFAEMLTHLTLYPIGTIVELNDGRIAVVVSVHANRTGIKATSRPVISVLTDTLGQILPRAEVVDLSSSEIGGIARALPRAERRRLFAESHPELCY